MTDFNEYSRKIASEFLQTVLIVDDKATLSTPNEDYPEIIEDLKVPGRATSAVIDPPVNQEPKNAEASEVPVSEAADEKLDAKTLNEAFASLGMVCGVLRPLDTEDRSKDVTAAINVAKRADIIVLDWKMEGEGSEGATALEIIDKILSQDLGGGESSAARLRLIAVYSQNPKLRDVIIEIKKTLKEKIDLKAEGDFTLCTGAIRICAYKKTGGINNATDLLLTDRTVDETELTQKLIGEFAELTKGLLSNAAIRALSVIRDNTHKLLEKFRNDLDAPYLTHRALTDPAEETETHITALISSEIHDILEYCNISKTVG